MPIIDLDEPEKFEVKVDGRTIEVPVLSVELLAEIEDIWTGPPEEAQKNPGKYGLRLAAVLGKIMPEVGEERFKQAPLWQLERLLTFTQRINLKKVLAGIDLGKEGALFEAATQSSQGSTGSPRRRSRA
jgi:hypothetical protein